MAAPARLAITMPAVAPPLSLALLESSGGEGEGGTGGLNCVVGGGEEVGGVAGGGDG
eukprot:CAMPEP_0202920472 /NCGR_PEP_ID=MMETSP1392-20130828/76877_1 /ASSEMBLY_ACC=CAM_ASM_000868 /TAXON_ID=225041 /ORGANISM="Chlamydomonas chlamydogama, Strain SAG 11-48b" /LENGTH=56 /DNA_ID=CAMNT_0049613969 /DNA_START=1186 /DNA_END=1352 /DNA_ORIENTATION=+